MHHGRIRGEIETYCFLFPEAVPGTRSAVSQLCAPRISAEASEARCPLPWSVPLHSNPSCNLKNSLNAGSSFKAPSSLGACAVLAVFIVDGRLSAVVGFEERHRHNWARSPSSCFRPFLILLASEQERESNDIERSDSMVGDCDIRVDVQLLVLVHAAMGFCTPGTDRPR